MIVDSNAFALDKFVKDNPPPMTTPGIIDTFKSTAGNFVNENKQPPVASAKTIPPPPTSAGMMGKLLLLGVAGFAFYKWRKG